MRLTEKLLGYLNRVFDKSATPFLALRFSHAQGVTWSIEDNALRLQDGGGGDVTVDLSQHSLATLATLIAGMTGYNLSYIDPDRATLSAKVLLDAEPNTTGELRGYTSLLWAYLEAFAGELTILRGHVEQAPLQMSVGTADGIWLDELGGYYGVPRQTGEADGNYGPRIIAETLRPRGNNIAMETAIAAYTGQSVQVVDVIGGETPFPLYDGNILHDGLEEHDAVAFTSYGLFDVVCSYDLLNGGDIDGFLAEVTEIIHRLRDAGTHLRALSLGGSALTDSFGSVLDATTVAVAPALGDTVAEPDDALAYGAAFAAALTDDVAAADDSEDDLSATYLYSHNGAKTYAGSILHLGDCVVAQSLDGTVDSITPL